MLQQLQYINDLLKNVMLIFPQYCLGLGLMEMSRNQLYSDAFKKFGQYFIHLYTNLFLYILGSCLQSFCYVDEKS